MTELGSADQRAAQRSDRRSVARGGRRDGDLPGRYPTVLVVDGDEPARRPCVRYLEHFGFRVEQASDGKEARAAIEQLHPQVIVAETPMRGLPRSARFDAGPIPLVEVRTYVDPDEVDAGLISPFALLKPFSLASMLDELRRVLRGRTPPARPE